MKGISHGGKLVEQINGLVRDEHPRAKLITIVMGFFLSQPIFLTKGGQDEGCI